MSTNEPGRNAAQNRFRRFKPVPEGPVAIPIEVAPPPDPRAIEFVRFCYLRRRVSWPELYDEMCLVAARGSFRGMSYEELAEVGVTFTLYGMPSLTQLAHRVVVEERAAARGSAVPVGSGVPVGPGVPVGTADPPRPRPHLTPVAS